MRNHRNRPAIALAVIFLLVTPEAIARKKDPAPASAPTPQLPTEARAYVFPECIVSSPQTRGLPTQGILDILSSFIPALVNFGYSAVSSALRKAGDPNVDTQAFAAAPFYLYQAKKTGDKVEIASHLGCVILLDGTFSPSKPAPVIQSNIARQSCLTQCSKADTAECSVCLQANGIPIDKFNLLYEAQVHFADDQSAIAWESRYFQAHDWLGSGRATRKHSYVVTLSLAAPGTVSPEDNVQSTAILNLGAREIGMVYGPAELPGASGWIGGGLGLSDSDRDRVKDLSADAGQATLKLRPSTLFASIAETAEGSKFAKSLADILDAAKPGATTAIAANVDPAQIQAKRKAAASDLENARETEEESYDAFLGAKVSLDTATAPQTASQTARLTFAIETAERGWCRDWNALKAQGVPPKRAESAVCAAK